MVSVLPLAWWQPSSRWRLRELVSKTAMAERGQSLPGQQRFVEKTSIRGIIRRKFLMTRRLVQALFPIIRGAVSMFCSICRKEASPLSLQFSSVQFSRSVVCNSLQPHEPQHSRPPCPSPTPRVYPNLCPLSWWCPPTISSSVIPFYSCPQSFPASGSFQMSQLFTSGGQSIGVSALPPVLPMNTQDWSPLAWAGWISLQSKGLSRVFSNTTVQKHQFFGAQLSL